MRAAAAVALLALAACAPAPFAPHAPASAADAAGASYGAAIRAQGAWLKARTLGDGALLYTPNEIEPYYANVAATGETALRSRLPAVRAWMAWYVAHLNRRDRWGLSGTIYDYAYDPATGRERSKRSADSIDSYAATFFTLALTLYDTGDPASQRYVRSIRPALETMAAMLLSIRQTDGMTIALPSYPVAFLMDNCEVYRGLRDLGSLERLAFAGASRARAYDAAAAGVAGGIASLWSPALGTYDYAKQEPRGPAMPSHWAAWYPDATAQLFPSLQGAIPPRSPRALGLWTRFNAAFPHWDRLQFPDRFPWALVAAAATRQGDRPRAERYVASVQARFAPAFPWPWYDLEAGWYVRALDALRSAPE